MPVGHSTNRIVQDLNCTRHRRSDDRHQLGRLDVTPARGCGAVNLKTPSHRDTVQDAAPLCNRLPGQAAERLPMKREAPLKLVQTDGQPTGLPVRKQVPQELADRFFPANQAGPIAGLLGTASNVVSTTTTDSGPHKRSGRAGPAVAAVGGYGQRDVQVDVPPAGWHTTPLTLFSCCWSQVLSLAYAVVWSRR